MISDGYPFFGFRRKSYLIFFGFVEAFCWFGLASWVKSPIEGVLVLIFVQVAVAFCNVIGEALLVEFSRDGEMEGGEGEEVEEQKR